MPCVIFAMYACMYTQTHNYYNVRPSILTRRIAAMALKRMRVSNRHVVPLKLSHRDMSVTSQQNGGERGGLIIALVLQMRQRRLRQSVLFTFSRTECRRLRAHRKVPIPDWVPQVICQSPCGGMGCSRGGRREAPSHGPGTAVRAEQGGRGQGGWPSFHG